jgi:hypothetical protein
MQLPNFDSNWLDLPDDKLGAQLLEWWIDFQAESRGIPSNKITIDIAENIRIATLNIDGDDANNSSLEKALILIARGEVARGGSLFRGYMTRGATDIKVRDLAIKGIKFKSGKRKGSLNSTNEYLKKLSIDNPNLTAKEVYKIALIDAENDRSPFEYDRNDGGSLWDGDNEISFEKFEKRLSKAKNR